MLDAAHGEAERPAVVVQWVHTGRMEPQEPGTTILAGVRRRSPRMPAGPDLSERPRIVVAVARSRRCIAIALLNAGKNGLVNN